jgi:hypothetical protein
MWLLNVSVSLTLAVALRNDQAERKGDRDQYQ